MRTSHSRIHRVALAALAAGAVLAGSAASAQAASTCPNPTLTQPFLPWGDSAQYELAPGGSFESGTTGWTITGGARTTAGSDPFAVTGSLGSQSLNLPAGASVQSPYMCVTAAYPTIRFFGRNSGLASSVLVQVVYPAPLLGTVTIPVGTVALSGSWQPTLPMITGSAITTLLSGGSAQVAVRFTAVTGSSQIDDIYVDPRMG
jgi:hypothetical protein